jgi:hypothetical protein
MKVSDKKNLAPAHIQFPDSYGNYKFEHAQPSALNEMELMYRIQSEQNCRLLFNDTHCAVFFKGKWFTCKMAVKNLLKMRMRIAKHRQNFTFVVFAKKATKKATPLTYNQFQALNSKYKYND